MGGALLFAAKSYFPMEKTTFPNENCIFTLGNAHFYQ